MRLRELFGLRCRAEDEIKKALDNTRFLVSDATCDSKPMSADATESLLLVMAASPRTRPGSSGFCSMIRGRSDAAAIGCHALSGAVHLACGLCLRRGYRVARCGFRLDRNRCRSCAFFYCRTCHDRRSGCTTQRLHSWATVELSGYEVCVLKTGGVADPEESRNHGAPESNHGDIGKNATQRRIAT